MLGATGFAQGLVEIGTGSELAASHKEVVARLAQLQGLTYSPADPEKAFSSANQAHRDALRQLLKELSHIKEGMPTPSGKVLQRTGLPFGAWREVIPPDHTIGWTGTGNSNNLYSFAGLPATVSKQIAEGLVCIKSAKITYHAASHGGKDSRGDIHFKADGSVRVGGWQPPFPYEINGNQPAGDVAQPIDVPLPPNLAPQLQKPFQILLQYTRGAHGLSICNVTVEVSLEAI